METSEKKRFGATVALDPLFACKGNIYSLGHIMIISSKEHPSPLIEIYCGVNDSKQETTNKVGAEETYGCDHYSLPYLAEKASIGVQQC